MCYSLFVLNVFSKGVCILVGLVRETTKVCMSASKTFSLRKGMLRRGSYSAGSC